MTANTRTINFLAIIAAFFAIAASASLPEVKAELIHYWPFDGNANDSAGSHDGMLNGDVSFAAGQFGQAAAFDGNGDRIVTGTNPLPGTNYTMAGWVLPSSIPDLGYIAGTQQSNDGGSFLRLQNNPTQALQGTILPATNTVASSVSDANAIPLSDWTHVALTSSTTEGLKIYVNGVQVGSTDASGTSQLAVNNFTVGSRPDAAQNFFLNGSVDDLAVWNEVLTPTQLSNAINLGAENYNGVTPSPTARTPYTPDANTLHLWHFDEPTAGPALPDSGVAGSFNLDPVNGANLGHGSYSAFGTSAGVSGNDSNDGLQGENISVSEVTGVGGAFTFEAIVNTSSLEPFGTGSVSQQIISMEAPGGVAERPFQFRIDPTGNLRFINIAPGVQQLDGPIPTTGEHAFTPGEWFHVAATYNGNENTVDNFKLYWTALDSSATEANEIFSGTLTNDLAGSAVLGVGNEFRSPSENLEGFIDEVRISDIARTPDDFLFAETPGVSVIPEPSHPLLVLISIGALSFRNRLRGRSATNQAR